MGGGSTSDKTRCEFAFFLKLQNKHGEWIYLGADSPGFGIKLDVKMIWGFCLSTERKAPFTGKGIVGGEQIWGAGGERLSSFEYDEFRVPVRYLDRFPLWHNGLSSISATPRCRFHPRWAQC